MDKLIIQYTCPVVQEIGMRYGSAAAAGIDLLAAYNHDNADGKWVIYSETSTTIDCGVKIVIPDGYYGMVAMRSGHGFRDLSCHIGTIDNDYRGPVKCRVRNHSDKLQTIAAGERFCQLILLPYTQVCWEFVDDKIEELYPTDRGISGYGSTGL